MVIISVVLSAMPLAAVVADEAEPPAGIDMKAVKVRTECFADVVTATGTIVPRATAVVTFNTPGFQIADISKQDGDQVKAGEEVAVVVPAGTPTLAADQSDAERRELTAKRVSIKSPASGVVLRRLADLGETIRGPLLILAVDGEMEAAIDVPNIHALDLNSGQSARFVTEDGREFSGHVRLAPADIDRISRLGQARISIDSGPTLRQGLSLHVAIDAGRACGPGVPLTAVRRDSDGVTLQVVKDGMIDTRAVTLGLAGDSDVEVKQGVIEGDVVIAEDNLFLRNGDKIHPIVADTRDNH